MEWRDQGIFLTRRPHGENSVITDIFTPSRGRCAGIVRGGSSPRKSATLQPGAQVCATWRARLEEHLGSFVLESLRSRQAAILGNRRILNGVASLTSLLHVLLPERQPYPRLYSRTEALMNLCEQPDLWPLAYVQWEVHLLQDLGFGLDLSSCAVLGETAQELSYISPRTGRAVSAEGAGEWRSRLLPLPGCLTGQGSGDDSDILQGLRVTGHFIERHLMTQESGQKTPAARDRFVALFTPPL